jgi:hydrophobe/amphiphile efflux-1 (HAE1) family protein
MFCRYFILRPVLSSVIAIIMLIAGISAICFSPIEQYPNIVPPCITVTATFPGANSEAIATTIAAPIEDQMAGVAHMIYMQSSSANGNSIYTLNIYFEVGTDLGSVESDVLNRINTAMPQLPAPVQAQGVVVRMNNPDLFLVIPFFSKTGYPNEKYISNYVQRYIYPEIEQVAGIGVVYIHGQRAYAMRGILNTNKMNYYHVSTQDIVNAVQDQNNQYTVGFNAMEPMKGNQQFNFLINPPGYYKKVKQFKNIVIRADEKGIQVVRLDDVADVKLDAEAYVNYFYALYHNKTSQKVEVKPATALLVYLAPGANQIAVKEQINAALEESKKHMPEGIEYYYHYDSSQFVILSVEAVVSTLLVAFVLVFFVIMLFIQNIRGTIIPILAIPVAIIGTFAITYMLGFSINTMTLFGMVLAIGIVVDDAIVVLECVERIMSEKGCDAQTAAIAAMEEVASPIIAIVLVLNAVFVPVAFLGGFSGVLMKQFAVTIAVSVTLSGIIALTLTPTLCATFLDSKGEKDVTPHQNVFTRYLNQFFEKFNRGFEWFRNQYLSIVTWGMTHVKQLLLCWVGIVVAVLCLFLTIPTALIPLEDMGYFYNDMHVAPAGSMHYNLQEAHKIALETMKLPYVERVAILGGKDIADNSTTKTNTSTISVILKPYTQRPNVDQDVNAAIAKVTQLNQQNKAINALAFNQPPIRGMSPTGGVTFYLQARQPVTTKEIYKDSVKLVHYLAKNYPAVLAAKQFYEVDTPQLYVNVDAQKAYLYGVTYADIYNAMQSAFGNYYINYFTKWNDLYWVILQGDYRFRDNPEKLNTIYVKSKTGEMIPVGSLASMEYKNGPEVVTRLNDYTASQISVSPNKNKGYTQGDVMTAIRDAVPKTVGKKYSIQWFGPSYQENLAGNQSIIAISLGLTMVFLILSALYELWLLPSVVIFALPCALLGAAITLFIFQKPNDLYFQVSLLTLMGLSAKNVILIVEFALDEVRNHGVALQDAAISAAKARFRPIIMTSLAFIFGSVSLVMATGAGANAQHSVGLGIIGGMLGSTCLATLFVPLFFVLAMRKSEKPVK